MRHLFLGLVTLFSGGGGGGLLCSWGLMTLFPGEFGLLTPRAAPGPGGSCARGSCAGQFRLPWLRPMF